MKQSITPEALVALFNQVFFETYNTVLIKGGNEPIYLPASKDQSAAQIVFAHGYVSSALHEIAHWCVAGAERRKLEDYGYWYAPDGRTAEQQAVFESVEVSPQAYEWIFSLACGVRFNFSADNLALGTGPSKAFQEAVYAKAHGYLSRGMSERPTMWTKALAQYFGFSFPCVTQLERDFYTRTLA